jgi:hypothetical protein
MVGGAARPSFKIAIEQFYLRTENRERNAENHQYRTGVHLYVSAFAGAITSLRGGLRQRALTSMTVLMAGIPEARFRNVQAGRTAG